MEGETKEERGGRDGRRGEEGGKEQKTYSPVCDNLHSRIFVSE